MKIAGKKYQGIFDITPDIVGFASVEQLKTLIQKIKANGENSVNIIFPKDEARIKNALQWMEQYKQHGFEVFSGDIDTIEKAKMAFGSGATMLTNQARVPDVERYVRDKMTGATFLPPSTDIEEIVQLGNEGFKHIKAYPMKGLENYKKLFGEIALTDKRILDYNFYVAGSIKTLTENGHFDLTQIGKYGNEPNVTHVAAKQPVDYFLKSGKNPDEAIENYVRHTKKIRETTR